MTAVIEAAGLSKSYFISAVGADGRRRQAEKKALTDLAFRVEQGEVLGIIGSNGAGKTTLLRILSRITAPTRGRARVRGRVAALLEVGTGMHPEMTGRENVFLNGALLGMSRREIAQRLEQIVDFAGVAEYIDTPIKMYSSGMKLRLAFAVGAHLSADILVVDEVLAVGDAAFQAKCLGVMREGRTRGRTTLFVSHNMAAIENLCSRILWLDGGRCVRDGRPDDVIPSYLGAVMGSSGATRTYPAPSDPTSAPAVHFTAARVSAPDGAPITQGDDLEVEVGLEVRRPVKGLQILVRIQAIEGYPVAACCNGDYGAAWDLPVGNHRVRVRISSVRLLPRTHLVSLKSFALWGAETFETLPDTLSFDVVPRDVLGTGVMPLADRGVTWFPAAFSVFPEEGAR